MPPRHRDRRGRGLRGSLTPDSVPLTQSRAERFDELVLDALERLERRWGDQLREVELAVEEVPPPPAAHDVDGPVRLGRVLPAGRSHPARIVVYRRPVEARAPGTRSRAALVHDVVVEQVAELLGLEPQTVDPDYGLGSGEGGD
ncbi:MAG TPA: metallopeptidase family protein [Candidatus Eisenbacteria bacterium]|nr:metallopeptidase family protein [Candidatus Eisenbacteria bacterium]